MKTAVLTDAGKIEVREVEVPALKPTEVLVKVKNCGICTLEQRLYSGEVKIRYPIVPGHEVSGEIIKVGNEVISKLKTGTPVAVDLVMRCGECYYCRNGQSNMCENRFSDELHVLGGFSEYIAVRASQVYPFSGDISFREASFTEPVACCVRSLKRINVSLAEDLLVIGAGTMGLLHLQVARVMGARVIVSDPDAKRLEKALELGAVAAINPEKQDVAREVARLTDGKGANAAVVTSAATTALSGVFESLCKTGRISIYTSYCDDRQLSIDANNLHRNEIMVIGTEGRTEQDFQQALRLLSFGFIDVKPLISRIITYDEIEEGIRDAMSGDTYRVILEHGE
ncbi:MAG: alcohol dehydrogenase catalytic domain-containing protein [Spirochaetales bacterium]|nr:alcohol dehydrogenase catalytic domain-containing protein [Spirochaetales bacterium]